MSQLATSPRVPTKLKWSKRIGLVSFALFLVKGLVWIGVLAAGWLFAGGCDVTSCG